MGMVLAPVIKGYGQDFDLSTCNFGCTSNDITILGFSLVDATTGLPVFNSISECQDGDTFQVKLEMNYSFNTAATRVNARFQGKLKFGLTEIFIDEYVGEFSSAANGGSGKMIIYQEFTWECGTNLSFQQPHFYWATQDSGPTVETTYNCSNYSNSKCSRDVGEIFVDLPIELPVVWHEISATSTPDQQCAEIKWSTLKEWESSHFEIERSLNNADRFEVIDSVAASTYSFEIKNYQFTDHTIPVNTTRVYYRVKQVDLDGSFEYSKVLMVNVNTQEQQTSTWQLYPNPAIGNDLKISLRNPKAYNGEHLHVKMISNLGVAYQILPECLDPYEIDIGDMIKNVPKGILVVELSWGNQVEILKVIKQ
ncbi:hypothetical protein GCM10026987_23410 [Belliella aquatica]|uniref:Secretion system C-terminal sorting domain-containing protein n=2 Tax=Belliella aquatica TaxID=1323734 RepID=A0ABQ1MKR7_9BACT|nr:hypothetical protein GCM10010993_20100 [Belliella aquatica]